MNQSAEKASKKAPPANMHESIGRKSKQESVTHEYV